MAHHYVNIRVPSSIFHNPAIGIPCGRPNQTKEGQVPYRSTFGRLSARVLVIGTANWFQILGGGVELNI